jgi:hypothetical protein
MKKRVRIYKMGGVQAMQNVGNVDSGPSEDELVSAAMTMIGEQQATPDEVLNTFVKNGIQPDKANQVITSVVEYINDQAELGNAQLTDSNDRAELEAEEMSRQEDAAREAEERARQKQMYEQMYADNSTTDFSDDEQVASDILMKYGGLPNKKTFVKNVFALTKKQMGGNPNSNKPMDDKAFGQKESGLNAFVRSAQDSANNALMRKDAEAMYSSLQPYFQDGGDVESQMMNFDPYHNLAHYSDAFEHSMPMDQTDIVQAQFGGMRPGQARRMQRRINRMVRQVPAAMYDARQTMFPQGINVMTMPMMGPQAYFMPGRGSYQGGPQLANIDVRKTGIFGRPKEYTINFAQEAYYNPQLRQDVIKQEQNNVETTVKETAEEQKAAETNTATTENKEVVNEIEKADGTGSTGGTGTDGTKKAEGKKPDQKKPDTGKDVEDEVKVNKDPNKSNKSIQYKGDFNHPGHFWRYDTTTKKWYHSYNGRDKASNDPLSWKTVKEYEIKDPERIKKLNEWKANPNKGGMSEYSPIQDYDSNTEGQKRDAQAKHLMSIPQAAMADDQLMFELSTLGAGILKNVGKGALEQFTFKKMPKGYLSGPKGLPSPKGSFSSGSFSSPNAWGAGPKGLTWSGSNVRYVPPGGFQEGGFTDQDSELYKFIYGGDEDFAIPQVAGKITDDPYFQYGGYFQTAGQTDSTPVEILDNNGNVVRQTTLADAEKNNLRHRVITTNTQTGDANRRRYDALKELGYNVGDFREGVDYSKVGNNTTTQQQRQQQGQAYYNPQVGAMYPPVFGGRRYSPPGSFGYAGSWVQQQGFPTDPRTGQVIGQMPTDLPLTKMDVTKSSMFGRRPKEFTMYYGNYGQLDGKGKPGERTPGTTPEGEESNVDRRGRIGAPRSLFGNNDGDINYNKLLRQESRGRKMRVKGDEAYEEMFGRSPSTSGVPLPYEQKPVELQNRGRKQMPNFVETQKPKSQEEVIAEWEKTRGYQRDGRNYTYKDPETGNTQQGMIPESFGEDSGSRNYHPALGFYAYGGYLPEAQTGLFTTNPNMVGYSDIDLLNSQTAPEIQGATSLMGNWATPMPGTNQPTIQDTGAQQPEQMFIDPNQPNRATQEREYDPRGAAVKYKVKNMYNVDFEKGVNQFNRGVNQALAMFGERGSRQRMADMQNNLTADNLYGSTGIQDRGTYDTNSGLFRPDEMGFKGVVRNGGFMQDGGDVYGEDDVTWMSEDQIRQFLAEGGEIEFIQE